MNYLSEIFSEQFIHALGWTLLHSFWQGALIGFAIAVIMIFLNKYTARLRYFINSLGLFVFAGLALVTFASSYFSFSERQTETILLNTSTSHYDESQYSTLPSKESGYAMSFSSILDTTAAYCREHIPLFITIWLMGMMAMMLRFLGGYALVRRYKTHKVKPVMGDWENRFRQLARSIRVRKDVKLLESALVSVPMAIGYLKPVVLIPLGALNGVPAQQMEAILVHELAHIKRRDYLVNLVQSLLEVIFFYHPVVWWLSKNIRIERENICDDIAITQTGNTMEFAKALTNIQEVNLGSPALAAGLSGKNKNRLLYRIRRLAGKPKVQSGFAEGFIAASILLVSMLGISAAAMIGNPVQDASPLSLNFDDVDAGQPKILYYNEPASHYNEPAMTLPDTTDRKKQEEIEAAKKEFEEQQKELQIALEAEMKAVEEKMKALDKEMEELYNKEEFKEAFEKSLQQRHQYEEQMKMAMQAYEEAMKNAQFNIQRSYNRTLPHIYFEDGKQYVFEGDSTVWSSFQPGHFWHDGDSLHEVFVDTWVDRMADHQELMEIHEGELLEIEEHLEAIEELELPDFYKHHAEPFKYFYNYDHSVPHNYSMIGTAKRIISEELYEDDLIEHGREYIILINKKQMLINGEKQSRSIFKKYRRLIDSLEEPWIFEDDGEFRIHIGH